MLCVRMEAIATQAETVERRDPENTGEISIASAAHTAVFGFENIS